MVVETLAWQISDANGDAMTQLTHALEAMQERHMDAEVRVAHLAVSSGGDLGSLRVYAILEADRNEVRAL